LEAEIEQLRTDIARLADNGDEDNEGQGDNDAQVERLLSVVYLMRMSVTIVNFSMIRIKACVSFRGLGYTCYCSCHCSCQVASKVSSVPDTAAECPEIECNMYVGDCYRASIEVIVS
jgi:hypothetical protein